MGIEISGILGLLILILDVVAIVKVLQSGASVLAKALWTVLILALPVAGLIIWFLLGPSGSTRVAASR